MRMYTDKNPVVLGRCEWVESRSETLWHQGVAHTRCYFRYLAVLEQVISSPCSRQSVKGCHVVCRRDPGTGVTT